LSVVPSTTQQTVSGGAHVPALHQVDSAWLLRLGHGQQTGAQSRALEHAEPAVPDFHGAALLTEAQVRSTFSPTAETELYCVAMIGAALHVAAKGVEPASLWLELQDSAAAVVTTASAPARSAPLMRVMLATSPARRLAAPAPALHVSHA
jgi:hypothetical protein